MAMKPAELQKHNALKLVNRMKTASVPDRFGAAAVSTPGRREQRRLDQAAGLVPFAVKLNRDLVAEVQALALQRGQGLNETVAGLLRSALDAA